MELLRAVVVLLGVSMFFSIITSVLTASEELRVNFPSGKYLGVSEKGSADSLEKAHKGNQLDSEDPDGRVTAEDIETGNAVLGDGTIHKPYILEKTELVEKERGKEQMHVSQETGAGH